MSAYVKHIFIGEVHNSMPNGQNTTSCYGLGVGYILSILYCITYTKRCTYNELGILVRFYKKNINTRKYCSNDNVLLTVVQNINLISRSITVIPGCQVRPC
jgi:hypothetical protein